MLHQRAGRHRSSSVVPRYDQVHLYVEPMWIVAVFPALVGNNGIVMAPSIDNIAFESERAVARAIVVAEIVVARGRPHKQGIHHESVRNRVVGSVDKSAAHDEN